MNIGQIEKKRTKLIEEISKLQDEVEVLDQTKQTMENKYFFKLVEGTTWTIPQDYIGLRLNEDSSHPIDTYVCKDMNLYPHGQTYIGPGVRLKCSDDEISITVDLTSEEYSKLTADECYNMQYKKLFEFVKENYIIVDFSKREEQIQYYKDKVKTSEKELAFIKSLFY